MNVYEKVKCSTVEHLQDLQIDVSTLYLIAAPKTPKPVRQEIIKRAQAGEPKILNFCHVFLASKTVLRPVKTPISPALGPEKNLGNLRNPSDALARVYRAPSFKKNTPPSPSGCDCGLPSAGTVCTSDPHAMTERGRLFLRALTESERKILVLVCAGYSNVRIAERTDTTEQVVKNRLRLILRKAGRRSRFELMAFSYHAGVVECPCKRRSASLQDVNGGACTDVSVTAPATL